MTGGAAGPGDRPRELNPMERRRGNLVRTGLRDAVFGLQDGLISTLGALTGIAEGTGRREDVILAGLVVVSVESLSMAAGSYLSSKSQRQYLERLLREEKESIERDPAGERREVRELYGMRGYSRREIGFIERRLFRDKALLLEDMAHKELGIAPASLEEPRAGAVVMGAAYLVGGLVPLAPYFFFPLGPAMAASVAGTFLILFSVGGVKGRLVGRSWWRSGVEMVAVAGAAALAGYWIGRWAGAGEAP